MKTKLLNKNAGWVRALLLLSLLIALMPATSVFAKKTTTPVGEFVLNEVVVKFDSEETALIELPLISGVVSWERLDFAPVFLLQYGLSQMDPVQEAKNLAKKRGVEYAHPNFVTASGHGVEGSHPVGDNPGGDPKNKQATDEMLLLDAVHPITAGWGVKVGVIDGGIQFDHLWFDGMTFAGHDFVDGDDYPYDEPGGEISGHGTFVAGILHMVAPGAEIVPYRVIDPEGRGDGFTIARAMERAVNEGCKLINLSIVLTDRHWAVRDAILYAEEHDVPVVVAAGNGSTAAYCYPAAESASISVAAIDTNYVLTDFSNYGDYIDVCAPGDSLYSAYVDGIYAWWSGTSFATPCVTGQLALMTQLYPYITIADYEDIIAEKSINLDQYNPGLEEMLGYGMIDTYKAVVAAGVLGIINNAFSSNPSISLTLTPDNIEASGVVGQSFNFVRQVEVSSSNAPAVFYAEVLATQNNFTTFQAFADIRTISGVTNQPVNIVISPFDIHKAGVYTNTIAFRIARLAIPVFLEIELTLTEPLFKEGDEQPAQFSIENYPNPFNPNTTISFGMPEGAHVKLKVYNLLGQEVDCLVDQWMPAGEHQVDFNGTNSRGEALSSGMYFYRIETNQKSETRKMILLK